MPEVKLSTVSKTALLICSTIFVLLCSELLLRTLDVDLRLLRKKLYYQGALLSIHRTSSDARRLFELVPNLPAQKMFVETHSKEIKYHDKISVSINALGFRDKSFTPIKKPGVFRIVIFGGSNTFGATVNDEDTYPAQMQKIFDKKYPGRVEVWNAGVSAYVLSQDVAYAETVIKKFDPDLLIFQGTNRGRRAFHYNVTLKELKEFFNKNDELFPENIPPLWQPDASGTKGVGSFLIPTGNKMHQALVSASALYRTFCIGLHIILGERPFASLIKRNDWFWGCNGQMISDRDFNLFAKRHKDKKIILFFIEDSASQENLVGIEMRENMGDFILDSKEKSPEYKELHPPSYVYAWYAQELCDFLTQKGYIPADILNHREPGF